MANPLTRNLKATQAWQTQKAPYESPSILMGNNTGVNLISGDVVVVDPGIDRSVKFAAAAGEASPLVVLADAFASGNVRCYPLYGIARIICDGAAIAPNDLIITSATARYGKVLEAEDPDSILGVAVTSKAGGATAEVAVLLLCTPSGGYGGGGGGGATRFQDLTDVDWVSFGDGDYAMYDTASGKMIGDPGGGGGEVNTASNVGSAGTGVYDSKAGVDLQFRKLNSLHAGLSIALDAPNQKVDFNLSEGSIDHDALLNYELDEHLPLPAAIIDVLTDHNLAAHTALGLYSDPSEIDHNGLDSLQGGAAAEYYHLTAAQHTELTNWTAVAVLSADGSLDLGTSGVMTAEQLFVQKQAQAGTAEVLATFTVSDAAAGIIRVQNDSSTDGWFAPRIDVTSSSSRMGLYLRVQSTVDAGLEPVLLIQTLIAGGAFTVRPALRVTNYGTSLLDILANGNVGLRYSTPATALHICNTEPYITLHNLSNEDTDYGRESRIIFKGKQSGNELTTLGVLEFAHDGTADDEKGVFSLKINSGADGDAPSAAITVLSDGSVGIGDTEPDELLAVGGHIHLDDGYKLLLGTGEDGELYSSSDHFYFKNVTSNKDIIFNVNLGGADTEVMRLLGSTARVGIGTTGPGYKLVVGNGAVGSLYSQHDIVAADDTDARIGAYANNAGISMYKIGANNYAGLYAYNYGTSAAINLAINEFGGNVGIGTTNPAPSAKVEIDSTTGALLIPRMSTTQKNALTAVNGMILYDATLNKFQGYENGSWTSFI